MILWRFKEESEKRTETWLPTAYRWVLEARKWMLGLTYQYQRDGVWHSTDAANWGLGLRRRPMFGVYHLYYDGPHCGVNLGFVWFTWGSPNCKKCWPE